MNFIDCYIDATRNYMRWFTYLCLSQNDNKKISRQIYSGNATQRDHFVFFQLCRVGVLRRANTKNTCNSILFDL